MEFDERWHKIDELGEGGQGKVFRVLDTAEIDIENSILPAIKKSVTGFAGTQDDKGKKETFEVFRKAIVDIVRLEDPISYCALKVLHDPEEARDPERAEDRINKEITAMSQISHPNLLKIIDYDLDDKWFVSEFHPKGALTKKSDLFTGNLVTALKAFRPLVEGVAELHKQGLVHRDIKPDNVFLDAHDNLVLGDFGLVFFTDKQHTRISETFENVGSRDWMPGWAFGMRIEDIKATFDVFSLGKLLWAMVSDTPILQLWYFDQPQFNLEVKYPDNPHMKLANALFKKCIVEWENACLPDASAFLEEVDKVLSILGADADPIDLKIKRGCKVCGIGTYSLIVNQSSAEAQNFGLNRSQKHRTFVCNHCGHVQWFYFRDRQLPHAWSE